MSKENNELITIDVEDMTRQISNNTGIDGNLVEVILDAELEFLTEKGIVVGGPESETSEVKYIHIDEQSNYIAKKTGNDLTLVNKVLEAEDHYLIQKGVMDES